MNTKLTRTTLIVILSVLAAMLTLTIAWSSVKPTDCTTVFGTYQNCQRY